MLDSVPMLVLSIILRGFLALVSSLLLAPLAIHLTHRFGLIDKPGKFSHKIHSVPTPLAGGSSLIICLILLSLFLGLWDDKFTRALVFAAVIVYLFGLLDDIRGFSAILKLTGQVLASVVLIFSNVSVHFISSLALPFIPPEIIVWLDFGLTLTWLVGVTNAMNMIDSKDGIVAGLSCFAFLFFVLITSLSGQSHLVEISTILLGITVGIYFYNVAPARLFLGDSGSQTLGFLVAAIALEYAPIGLSPLSSWFVPILILGMPIFDTSLVVYSRLRNGLPIYKANLDHTYHRLVALGLDERRAVFAIHMTAILLSLVAFVTFYLPPVFANIIFVVILLAGIEMILLFERYQPGEQRID